jgi:hypothetical protein
MTRFMVANSQAFGPTRSVRGAFGVEFEVRTAGLYGCGWTHCFCSEVASAVSRCDSYLRDGRRSASIGWRKDRRQVGLSVTLRGITDVHGLATLSGCGSATGLRLTASLVGYVPATAAVALQDTADIEITLSKRMVVQ